MGRHRHHDGDGAPATGASAPVVLAVGVAAVVVVAVGVVGRVEPAASPVATSRPAQVAQGEPTTTVTATATVSVTPAPDPAAFKPLTRMRPGDKVLLDGRTVYWRGWGGGIDVSAVSSARHGRKRFVQTARLSPAEPR